MVTESSIDLGTLGWVKDEIDETLKQARLALEAFVEHRSDEAKLRLCASYLHQVSGTLKMVEVDALADLVGEAEASVQALLATTEPPREEALEPLVRALLLFPDILDRVQTRGLGDGLALLGLANELRAGRGAEPLPPQAFFRVDLTPRPPGAAAADDVGFVEAFRQQRSLFQAALLKWLKGVADEENRRSLPDLVRGWRAYVAFAPLAQCLWVAEAFLRLLIDAPDPRVEDKKLISRLDQLLKRFADGQDRGGSRSACERLTRDMLFVLREGVSSDPVIMAVREAFGLARPAPDESTEVSMAALRSIASALSQEIAQAQSLLSRCFDPHETTDDANGQLVLLLDKMAKTFATLEVAPLGGLAAAIAEACRALADGRLQKSGAVAMALAQGLLQIESAAREIPYGASGWRLGIDEQTRVLVNLASLPDTSGMEVSEGPLSAQDRRQLVGAVSTEIRANLARIEEAFLAFVASPRDREGLAEVPALAAQVEAAFRVLEEEPAADLARALHGALNRLAQGHLAPGGAFAEALAAAVAGLEAHVNGLERGRPLRSAELADLARPLSELVREEPAGEAVPPQVPAVTGPQLAIDPEILPVFLEDAHQAVAQLDEALAAWRADLSDENAVTVARRAFHTLKGSGRMVEAGEIAELSYDAETLLNKIRAREQAASPAALTWVARAHEVVRDWVAAVEQGQGLPEMAVVRDALQALAAGREPSPATPVPDTATGPITLPAEGDGVVVLSGEGAASGDEILVPGDEGSDGVTPPVSSPHASPLFADPLLRDIFVAETRDHLRVLAAVLADGPHQPVSADLLRAVHTMQGSARSVALLAMADSCAGLERYLQAREIDQKPLGTEAADLLGRLAVAIEGVLAALGDNADPDAPLAALAERLDALMREGLPPPGLTWWQKNLALQEGVREAAPGESDGRGVPEGAVVSAPPGERSGGPIEAPQPVDPVVFSGADAPREAIDPELRAIFRDEARDLLDSLEAALVQWREYRDRDDLLDALKRVLHTLKGGARMCGAERMGDVAHATEDLLRRVEDGQQPRDERLFALLDAAAEHLGGLYNAFVSGRDVLGEDITRALMAGLSADNPPDEEFVAPPPVPVPAAAPAATIVASPALNDPAEDLFKAEAASQVRVHTALLDRLVAYAGEVSIARARMEQQIFSLKGHLAELNGNVKRFRDQVRELEIQAESQIVSRARIDEGNVAPDFDPLEFDRYSRLQHLSRGLTENLHDLITVHGTLDAVASQAEAVLQQQARVNTELQEGLMRTRMVRFATQAHRLRQIVRQTARELNKRAELVLAAADVELDRHLLERMIGPFEHMIRNAIDHGLETTAERERLGKRPVGTITIQAAQESGEIVIRVSDDGAGLNVERIRAKAIERKLVPTAALVSDEQVMQFILLPGFSTAARITHLSGRGVGMDVVHSEVKKLGGAISVDTQPGRGTTFVIRLPLTLSITQALMVGCGDQMFAIPLAAIVNIVEAPAGAIMEALAGDHPNLRYGGRDYPFMDLGARLGIPRGGVWPRKLPVLLLRLDTREVAVGVDSLFGTREIVVKSLGPQLGEIRGLFGATIMGDGRVLLILDIPALWSEAEGLRVNTIAAEVPAVERPYVLVVDDSLTVRKVTTRFLQKQGYDAATAKDGIEALEQLRDRIPDVMLVDIEMPRMDGYELTARVRADTRLRHVPIVMITSRSGRKHREHAMALGVDVYLGKPYQEEDLRQEIEGLLRRGHS
ncbi:MAG: hybrid sensor histidine kinase/response regulator [Acidiferrobacter thiooxydans]